MFAHTFKIKIENFMRLLYFLILNFVCITSFSQTGEQLRNSFQQQSSSTFSKQKPEYDKLYYWAAHPFKKDMADSIPEFLKNEKRDTLVDVFFLHPTTYTKDLMGEWNADVNDEKLNEQTNLRPILYQASIFNGSCKVYAPRYRQANLRSFFLRDNPKSTEALDLAYQDIKTAFEYYLSNYNKGRPIIIASHSQGSKHAIRLLKEFFDGKPLQKQLICAYVVGWNVNKDDFTSIPFGNNPSQTGCVVSWRSYKNGAEDNMAKDSGDNILCVNPITWKSDNTPSTIDMHKGMIGKDFNVLYPKSVVAEVEEKQHILWVDLPEKLDESKGFLKNYHIVDYNLFYMDVRENVRQRVAAFFANK